MSLQSQDRNRNRCNPRVGSELNESQFPLFTRYSHPVIHVLILARHTPAVGPAIEAINWEEHDGPAPDAPEPTEG